MGTVASCNTSPSVGIGPLASGDLHM
jgi:hypothetical protein